MPGSISSGSGSSSFSVRREVDYYLNPTELFRWINYRRWDGARARASSHPEECGTWIVSKNADGGINWRHLPIHLVCMQCGNATADTINQIESLLDALLLSYPEGASVPDSQGMLPLHLAVSHGASEKFLSSLVSCYPNGAHKKDKFGRSPIDIVNDGPPGPRRDMSLQVLRRAKNNVERMTGSIRKEAAAEVAAVTQSAANERVASQRIIMRLEEELAKSKAELDEMRQRRGNQFEKERSLENKLNLMQKQLEKSKSDIETVRDERDQLKQELKPLHGKVENHDNAIAVVQMAAAAEREKQNKIIAELRSDVATARAMTDAVENQLRSRFTNEEEMATEISNLEASLSKTRGECEAEKRRYRELKEQLESENDHLKKAVEDLNNRNSQCQTKISDLNKQLNNLLSSFHSLNTEHERVMETTSRYEHEFIDAIQQERDHMSKSITKQKLAFESAVAEQQRIMDEAAKKERLLQSNALEERKRAHKVIEGIKQEFKAAMAAERERKIKEASRFKSEPHIPSGLKSNNRSNSSVTPGVSPPASPSSRRSTGQRLSRSKSKSFSTSSYDDKRNRGGSLQSFEEMNISSPKSSFSSKRGGLHLKASPTDTTLSSGPAPAGEGHLLRLLEDRAEGKLPNRYNRINSGSRQMSFGVSTFDDQTNDDDSSSFTHSTDSIGYSFNKQKVNVMATRERYKHQPSIDERDEASHFYGDDRQY